MTTTEENISLDTANDDSTPQGGELLDYVEEINNTPQEVQVEVDNITVAVIRGLLGSITPAKEVDKLIGMRAPVNDNNEGEEKKAA